jgi:hypothetical protein
LFPLEPIIGILAETKKKRKKKVAWHSPCSGGNTLLTCGDHY